MPSKQSAISKLILVILDGCRYDTACEQMGGLNHLIEHQQGQLVKVKAEMPSNSRPLYEVLMTGLPTYQNGIYTNQSEQCSTNVSLFNLVKQAGGKTAAAAYHWYSELYNSSPYQIATDRHQHDESQAIQHGIFYSVDNYPDSHLFADTNYLLKSQLPDFLLVHSMNIDDTGHRYTATSKEYRGSVNQADQILNNYLYHWLEQGYQVIVTADHGMDEDGLHGGNLPSHRDVPLYVFSQNEVRLPTKMMPQLLLPPLLCRLMNVTASEQMRESELDRYLEGAE